MQARSVAGVPTLWTIGYEKLRPEALVAELEAASVQRLIDVRFRPQSRRPGMSKTKLGLLLAEHQIVYEHRRSLGTPPELRWLYKNRRVAEGAQGFAQHIEATASDELDAFAAELEDPAAPRTALLCLEAEPAECHRRVLAEHLRERLPRLSVIDL